MNNEVMDIKEATDIINFNKKADETETLMAYEIFFKTYFSVNVKNEDGSYKSILDVFSEASNNMKNVSYNNY